MNKNCLSYWFPRLANIGVPVPRTEIVYVHGDLTSLLDGVEPAHWRDFIGRLESAANRIGYPCFLRTGQTSGKHNWKDTCYVNERKDLSNHVAALVEFSAMADFIGLPSDVWAVRELLPVNRLVTLERYGDMPLVREFRGFIRDGKVQCVHNYWPRGSVLEGTQDRGDVIDHAIQASTTWTEAEEKIVRALLLHIAIAGDFSGYWSVDVLDTERGWYVTDMALGEQSFHWTECEHCPEEMRRLYADKE